MPLNYGAALYEVGARRGQIIGQGLMGLGEGVAGGLRQYERKKERKEEKKLAKSVALLNIYTKIGDQIKDPKQKMDFYTAVVMPTLAGSGIIPEDIDKDTAGKTLANIALQSEKKMQGFRDDLDYLNKLATTKGKQKEAIKFANGMLTEYSNMPGINKIVENVVNIAKDEIEYGRGLEKEERGKKTKLEEEERAEKRKREEEKRAEQRKARGLLAEGKTLPAKRGEQGAFEYGGLYVKAPPSEAEKPEMTEAKALKEIRQIEDAIKELESTGGVDPAKLGILAITAPELAGQIAKGTDVKKSVEMLRQHQSYLAKDFVKEERWPDFMKKKAEKGELITATNPKTRQRVYWSNTSKEWIPYQ